MIGRGRMSYSKSISAMSDDYSLNSTGYEELQDPEPEALNVSRDALQGDVRAMSRTRYMSEAERLTWTNREEVMYILKSRYFDAKLTRINAQLFFLSFLGFAAMVVYNEICFNKETLVFNNTWGTCPSSVIITGFSWLMFLIFVYRLGAFYRVKSSKKKDLWNFHTEQEAFMNTTLKWRFLGELLVHVVQPVPYIAAHTTWPVLHKLVVAFMFARSYLLVRFLQYRTHVYMERETIKKQSSKFGQLEVEYRVGLKTVIKTYFFTHTLSMVVSLTVYCFLVCSYMMYISERETFTTVEDQIVNATFIHNATVEEQIVNPLQPSRFGSLSDSMWFVMVTATTAGYGDLVPETQFGRVMAMLSAMSGIIISSLVVGVITNKLAPDPFEDFIINQYSRIKILCDMENYAASIIQLAWRETKKLVTPSLPIIKSSNHQIIKSLNPQSFSSLAGSSLRPQASPGQPPALAEPSSWQEPVPTRMMSRRAGFEGGKSTPDKTLSSGMPISFSPAIMGLTGGRTPPVFTVKGSTSSLHTRTLKRIRPWVIRLRAAKRKEQDFYLKHNSTAAPFKKIIKATSTLARMIKQISKHLNKMESSEKASRASSEARVDQIREVITTEVASIHRSRQRLEGEVRSLNNKLDALLAHLSVSQPQPTSTRSPQSRAGAGTGDSGGDGGGGAEGGIARELLQRVPTKKE